LTDVHTQIRYINPEWRDRSEPPSIGSRETRRANTAYQDVSIHDARAAVDAELGLDTSGFALVGGQAPAPGHDKERIPADYYPRMQALVQEHSGADRVYVMAHQVRTEDRSDFNNAYARFVHCDYNLANLEAMSLNTLDKHEVEGQPGWRYAWYNTWQPFDHEVQQNALAMCDARSLADGDVIGYRYTGYVGKAGTGEASKGEASKGEASKGEAKQEGGLVAAPVFNPDHRWYYYSNMGTDEVLLMKQLDARAGRAPLCPHTSFIDPSVGDDAPPRRSVEVRLLAVFEGAR
jgi:hypothetical protein